MRAALSHGENRQARNLAPLHDGGVFLTITAHHSLFISRRWGSTEKGLVRHQPSAYLAIIIFTNSS